mmetsp:Transcript_250/g.527  ORF Transcript_250/g.527 Transcript_250/m.527 type:complete len:298 (+) Transcript_250:323-1216(+)
MSSRRDFVLASWYFSLSFSVSSRDFAFASAAAHCCLAASSSTVSRSTCCVRAVCCCRCTFSRRRWSCTTPSMAPRSRLAAASSCASSSRSTTTVDSSCCASIRAAWCSLRSCPRASSMAAARSLHSLSWADRRVTDANSSALSRCSVDTACSLPASRASAACAACVARDRSVSALPFSCPRASMSLVSFATCVDSSCVFASAPSASAVLATRAAVTSAFSLCSLLMVCAMRSISAALLSPAPLNTRTSSTALSRSPSIRASCALWNSNFVAITAPACFSSLKAGQSPQGHQASCRMR